MNRLIILILCAFMAFSTKTTSFQGLVRAKHFKESIVFPEGLLDVLANCRGNFKKLANTIAAKYGGADHELSLQEFTDHADEIFQDTVDPDVIKLLFVEISNADNSITVQDLI